MEARTIFFELTISSFKHTHARTHVHMHTLNCCHCVRRIVRCDERKHKLSKLFEFLFWFICANGFFSSKWEYIWFLACDIFKLAFLISKLMEIHLICFCRIRNFEFNVYLSEVTIGGVFRLPSTKRKHWHSKFNCFFFFFWYWCYSIKCHRIRTVLPKNLEFYYKLF